MAQYDPEQQSPFQSLIEQATRQELARPRGHWGTTIHENVLSPSTRPQWGPDGRMYMEHNPGGQSQLAALSQAAAHNDAAVNQLAPQRLNALLAAGGQAGANQADMARAQAAADDVALKKDPAYQDFLMKHAAMHGTQEPYSNPFTAPKLGVPPTPSQQVGTALNVPPGTPPPATFDQAVKQHIDQGGGPIGPEDPLYGAFQKQYGADMNARLAGQPIGWAERLNPSPLSATGGLSWMLGADPRPKSDAAKRIFARVAPTGPVGVKTSRPRMASGITQAIDGLEQK